MQEGYMYSVTVVFPAEAIYCNIVHEIKVGLTTVDIK